MTPIQITANAARELRNIIGEQNIPEGQGLRIGVKGGGCSGLSYVMGFDQKKEGDAEFDVDGIKVLMHESHEMYLSGMELDYYEGLENRGFVFNNPNAGETCGCGSSFSA